MKEEKVEKKDDIVTEDSIDSQEGDVDVIEEESRIDNKLTKVKKELEKCRSEKQEYLDGWQRAKADYVNALKRFKDEKQGAAAAGIVKAVESFLPIMDSLERAQGAGELSSGFSAIAKQIESAFLYLGVSEISANINDVFDPQNHEALGQDKTDDIKKDGTISSVLEKGWKVQELVIRPAKIRIFHHE